MYIYTNVRPVSSPVFIFGKKKPRTMAGLGGGLLFMLPWLCLFLTQFLRLGRLLEL